MTTYVLSAHKAERTEFGYSVRFNLGRGTGIPDGVADIRKPDELVAAKREYGVKVLADNPEFVTVAVGHRPVGRHANGCKALDYNLLVDREPVNA